MGATLETVGVRDVQSGSRVRLPGETPVYRVPYDAFVLDGPASIENGALHYQKRGMQLEGRAASAHLGECKPGDRVLVSNTELAKAEQGLWLCEVEDVRGSDIS